VVLATSSDHPSDSSLIGEFKNHEAQFANLGAMAEEDSKVIMVQDTVVGLFEEGANTPYIYLHKGKSWPASEIELNFSKSRWNQYLNAFEKLGLKGMYRKRTLPQAVFLAASIKISELNNDETAVIEKGYAYVPGNLKDNLKDTLDDIKVDRPAIFYRKIKDQWYLYYQWSVSKPE